MVRKTIRPLFLLSCLVAIGCGPAKSAVGPAKPVEVIVGYPLQKSITDYEEFPGRLDAVYTVQVRARAQGYLTDVKFTDGQEVEEGQVLAIIQQEPYEALVKAAKAQVALNEANLKIARVVLSRAQVSGNAASPLEIDQDQAQVDQAEANLRLAQANLTTAQINLDYTLVRSPLTGRISRRMVDPGNVVKTDDTVLTTIVSFSPVYVYFDIDERTMLRLERLAHDSGLSVPWKSTLPMRKGSITADGTSLRGAEKPARPGTTPPGVAASSPRNAGLPVEIGLADEDGYPHHGTIDFADNVVNRQTGTLRVRGVIENTTKLLTPGMYCRVRVPIGSGHPATLVAEYALGMDQGRKYLYVLNADNEVLQRDVHIGSLHDGFRVVEGVAPDERVVIDGLQRVKSGIKVEPKVKEMTPVKGTGKEIPVVSNKADGK